MAWAVRRSNEEDPRVLFLFQTHEYVESFHQCKRTRDVSLRTSAYVRSQSVADRKSYNPS